LKIASADMGPPELALGHQPRHRVELAAQPAVALAHLENGAAAVGSDIHLV
jgi:hypothetical protein